MVQVGATVSYHNPMDEKPEPSWSAAIRTAVKEFVEAVSESSKELATATERFTVESLQAADAARLRSEQSAETSSQMAQQAQQAAEEARNATAGLQSAVEEAREQVRQEARQTVEQVASHAARISEIGAQVKYDLQQRIEEMVARIEAGANGHREALETAQAATTAAQAAANRIEVSVNAVDAAVASARQAAEEARSAADQAAQNMGSMTMAVASAQEAAESSRQAASLAEQAGKRSDFANEASMLLERLETDYALLTRLVQELHSRISSLSSVTAAPAAPVYQAPVQEAPASPEEPPIEAYQETPEEVESWQPEYAEASQPQGFSAPISPAAEPQAPSGWPEYPPEDLELAAQIAYAEPEAPAEQATQPEAAAVEQMPQAEVEPAPQTEAPMAEASPAEAMPEAAPSPVAAATAVTLFGRVQMMISPVPDFDRLLSLDSALARIQGVHSVTLADYAREEVIFRVELERPVSAADFASHLSETAGVPTTVTEASESTLSIRIG